MQCKSYHSGFDAVSECCQNFNQGSSYHNDLDEQCKSYHSGFDAVSECCQNFNQGSSYHNDLDEHRKNKLHIGIYGTRHIDNTLAQCRPLHRLNKLRHVNEDGGARPREWPPGAGVYRRVNHFGMAPPLFLDFAWLLFELFDAELEVDFWL